MHYSKTESLLFGIFFLLTCNILISHERLKSTGSEIEKFVQTEMYYKNKEISREYRVKTLKKNLYSAIRHSLQKRYPNYNKLIKEIKEDDIKFEYIPNSLNYFVRVKNYSAYYLFTLDPELYIQLPVDEKFFENTFVEKADKLDNTIMDPVKD